MSPLCDFSTDTQMKKKREKNFLICGKNVTYLFFYNICMGKKFALKKYDIEKDRFFSFYSDLTFFLFFFAFIFSTLQDFHLFISLSFF